MSELDVMQAVAERALEQNPAMTVSPATVVEYSIATNIALVRLDGSTTNIGADALISGRFAVGERVMVLLVPPHGAHIVGWTGGDRDIWHNLNDPGEPTPFAGWTVYTGAAFPPAGFRRYGEHLRLRGALTRATSGGGIDLFTLPEDWRPIGRHDTSNNNNGAYGAILVNPGGGVQQAVLPAVGGVTVLDAWVPLT